MRLQQTWRHEAWLRRATTSGVVVVSTAAAVRCGADANGVPRHTGSIRREACLCHAGRRQAKGRLRNALTLGLSVGVGGRMPISLSSFLFITAFSVGSACTRCCPYRERARLQTMSSFCGLSCRCPVVGSNQKGPNGVKRRRGFTGRGSHCIVASSDQRAGPNR